MEAFEGKKRPFPGFGDGVEFPETRYDLSDRFSLEVKEERASTPRRHTHTRHPWLQLGM